MGMTPQQYTERLAELQTRYEHLMAISRELNSTFDLPTLLKQILNAVTDLTQTETASIMLIDTESGDLRFEASHDLGVAGEDLDGFVIPMEGSIAGWVATHGEHQLIPDVSKDTRFFSDVDDEVGTFAKNMLAVPLKAGDDVIGVVEAINKRTGEVWEDDDIPMLSAFADQAAIAIQTARYVDSEIKRKTMERDLEIGKQIQLSLLPKSPPKIPGWTIAATYTAARQVGGDFYDFFRLPIQSPTLGMVVADVADKGVPAALFMAVSRTVIRSTARARTHPAEVLAEANELIAIDADSSNLFVTTFYATLNIVTGKLTCANGGHNPPYLWDSASGEFKAIHLPGVALGIMPNAKFDEEAFTLVPGDFVIFYSDGVTEAMNADREQFEEERLVAALPTDPNASAQDILDALVHAVNDFTGNAPQFDDFTAFVVKRMPMG